MPRQQDVSVSQLLFAALLGLAALTTADARRTKQSGKATKHKHRPPHQFDLVKPPRMATTSTAKRSIDTQPTTTPSSTQCTSSALQTIETINRGGEGVWMVKANQSGLTLLHSEFHQDWLDNNRMAVVDECSSICVAGNSTDYTGQWVPLGLYFEGAFVNTPGGQGAHPLWECACYSRALSQDDVSSGKGVDNGANPGSGTFVNRDC